MPRAESRIGGTGTAPRPRTALLAALAAFAIALVAAASDGLLSRLRDEVPGISIGAVLGDLVAVLLAAVAVGYVVLGYAAWVERAPRQSGPHPPARDEEEPQRVFDRTVVLLPLLFASGICLAIALAWLLGHPGGTDGAARLPTPAARAPGPAPTGGEGESVPVHWLVFAVVSAAGVAVAAAFFVRDLRRRRAAERPSAADELAVAVDASLEDLEREPDPRAAVVKAYGRMERALASCGAERRPPETPSEYLARALTAVRVSRRSVGRLTALFQEAKFSAHPIDDRMKDEAIAALRELRTELAP